MNMSHRSIVSFLNLCLQGIVFILKVIHDSSCLIVVVAKLSQNIFSFSQLLPQRVDLFSEMLVLLLQSSSSFFNANTFSPFIVKNISSFFKFVFFISILIFDIVGDSFYLPESTFLLSSLISNSLSSVFILINFISESFVFFFYLSDHSIKLLFFTESFSSLALHLFFDFANFFSSQLWLSLHGHIAFIVISWFLNFFFDLGLKSFYFFYIKHTFSSFVLQCPFKITDVTISSLVLLFIFIKFLLLFDQHFLEFLDSILINSAFSSFIVKLSFQKVDFVFCELNSFSCFVELLLFSIGFIIFSFQLRLKLSNSCFIS